MRGEVVVARTIQGVGSSSRLEKGETGFRVDKDDVVKAI